MEHRGGPAGRERMGWTAAELLLLLGCFLICLTGSLLLPVNQCPDEYGRNLLIDWMCEHHSLPTGDEMDTAIMEWAAIRAGDPNAKGWGFSYALRPYLSAMVGAFFREVCGLFTRNPRVLLSAGRMGSVLSVTLGCYFCLKLGRRVFRRRSSVFFCAAFVSFLPQVMFLGMYHNNDAPALCAVCAMSYYLVRGDESHWRIRDCVGLAVSFALGALTYYSAYPWFLMGLVYCVIAVLRDAAITDKGRFLLGRAALVGGICLALAGWFFLRNAILHQGDFLGLAEELRSRQRYSDMGYALYPYISAKAEGVPFLSFLLADRGWFIRCSIASFFGVFGYMDTPMPLWLYVGYCAVTLPGLGLGLRGLAAERPAGRLGGLAAGHFAASAAAVALCTWHAYARDFQAQGRYFIPAALCLGLCIAYGLDTMPRRKDGSGEGLAWAAGGLWLALFVLAAVTSMSRMLV